MSRRPLGASFTFGKPRKGEKGRQRAGRLFVRLRIITHEVVGVGYLCGVDGYGVLCWTAAGVRWRSFCSLHQTDTKFILQTELRKSRTVTRSSVRH
jgi:hypothetical protein